jgi:cytochrome b involved in lipid metabolism
MTCPIVPHRGRDDTSVFEQLHYAARRLMVELYLGMLRPTEPVSRLTPAKCERNEEIRRRHQRGESQSRLAEVFGLTEQRIWQFANSRRK